MEICLRNDQQKYFDLDGHKVPQVFEVSFANNYYFCIENEKLKFYNNNYPIENLDYPCAPITAGYIDHDLTKLMFS